MTLGSLVDLYLTEIARVKRPNTEITYTQTCNVLLRLVGANTPITNIREEDCLRVLDAWRGKAKSTQALHHTVLKRLFEFARKRDWMKEDPMKNVERPKVPKAEDKEVTVVSTTDVLRMFQACEDWGDEICLGLISQTGVRRNAASMLRWRDLNLEPDPPDAPFGWMRFQEKGGKRPWKPIPQLLRQILDRAPEHGPEDYVVPNYNPELVQRPERHNSIIYERVKRIASRAGVKAHVHALRAEFAVFFLESNPDALIPLQGWLGHESIETTRGYLRALNHKRSLSRGLYLDRSALSAEGATEAVASGSGDTVTRPSAESASMSPHEEPKEQLVAHNLLSGQADSSLDQRQRELYPDVLGSLLARQRGVDNDMLDDIEHPSRVTMTEERT